jgi:hypothetical protein
MATVVYLANQQVQIVNGTTGTKRISAKNCITVNAPEGSIINGIIMDMESFVEFMRGLWDEYKLPTKDVYVVSNSTKFTGKNIEMPRLSDRKTMAYIEREFQDLNRDGAQVYGYIPLKSNDIKTIKLYAEGVPAELLKDYVDVFKELGIKLKGIYSGESSLIWLVQSTIAAASSTFVLEIADGMNLTTLLWANGTFTYFNSMRCFHEQGTPEYAADLARSVGQIIQFMQANQIEQRLECIYLAGIDPNNLKLYQTIINQQGIDVPVNIFQTINISADSFDIQRSLHPLAGLYYAGKRQNFLTQYEKTGGKGNGDGKSHKELIAIGASLAGMLIILGVALTVKTVKKKELEELKAYNESPDVIFNVSACEALQYRNAFLTAQFASIQSIDENIYTYPVCNTAVLNVIEKCAGDYAEVSFESLNAETGIISITAQSGTVDDINKFIKAMSEQDIFNDIDYTGYEFVDETGLWNINISCTLAESAGR